MSLEVYSGVDSILKAVVITTEARPLAVGIPVEIANFRSIEISKKAPTGKYSSNTTDGWEGAVGGQGEWDATLLLYVPQTVGKSQIVTSGIGGDVTTPALAHVRKITRKYANKVEKYGSSDTLGWKQTCKGQNSYDVTIDCWADAGQFDPDSIEVGDTVSIVTKSTADDAGLTGDIVIESIGGFKVGPEAGTIGFTIVGQGHLEGDVPIATPWILGGLVSLEVLVLGTSPPEVAGFARIAGIEDFVIDVEGATAIGVSIKLAGDGPPVNTPVA
jgi:hypothetical protein